MRMDMVPGLTAINFYVLLQLLKTFVDFQLQVVLLPPLPNSLQASRCCCWESGSVFVAG